MLFVYPLQKQLRTNELKRKGKEREEQGGGIKEQFSVKRWKENRGVHDI
jgi:hypothetical protein